MRPRPEGRLALGDRAPYHETGRSPFSLHVMRFLVLALLATSAASAQVGPPPLPDTPPPADGPPLEIRVDQDEYAVAGPGVGGTGLWVTVTERAGTDFDPCSGVAERLVDGAWVPADTLRCERPDRPARPEGAVALNQFHLPPRLLRASSTRAGPTRAGRAPSEWSTPPT